jgi:Pregnancy-associated plasma protein-A
VYVHVVSDGRIGALTDSEISAQLRVLNQTFAGAEGGATTGFSFQLAGVTRTDNADWFYAGPGGVDENSMKTALRQRGPNALNLYSTTAGAYLGWAYLPEIVNKPGQTHLDGIVIDWESMPRTSKTYAGQFDEGKTATHEVGHWLDLEHTFYRGCSAGATTWRTLPRRRPRRRDAPPEGHLLGPRPRPDPQLHGLLVRQLLHGVHARPGAADARRLAALPGGRISTLAAA